MGRKRKKSKKAKKMKGWGMHYDGNDMLVAGRTICSHKGEKSVMQINGCNVFASSTMWGDEDGSEFGLVLNCANVSAGQMTVPHKMRHLLRYWERAGLVIRLPWRDYGPPPVTYDFWPALCEELKKLPDLLVMCTGSHGRTGTALACLWISANPKCGAKEAVELIRKIHCADAIESLSQIDYIVRMAEHFGAESLQGSMGDLLPEKKARSFSHTVTEGGTTTIFPVNDGCKDCYSLPFDNKRCLEHAPIVRPYVPETTDENSKKGNDPGDCSKCFVYPDYDICKFHAEANDCSACLKLPVAVYCGEHTKKAADFAEEDANMGVNCG